MKVKVLPLPLWAKHINFDDYKQIEPIFNRSGRYYDRDSDKCWFEVDGLAFLEKDSDQFLLDLEGYKSDYTPLPDACVTAIQVLFKYGIKNKELEKLLYDDQQRRIAQYLKRKLTLFRIRKRKGK